MGIEEHVELLEPIVRRYGDALAKHDLFHMTEIIPALLPYVLTPNVALAAILKIDFAMGVLIDASCAHDELYRQHLGKGRKPSEMFRGQTVNADLHYLKRHLYQRASERFFAENQDILQRREEILSIVKDNRSLLDSSTQWLYVVASSGDTRAHLVHSFDLLEDHERTYLVAYIQDVIDQMFRKA